MAFVVACEHEASKDNFVGRAPSGRAQNRTFSGGISAFTSNRSTVSEVESACVTGYLKATPITFAI